MEKTKGHTICLLNDSFPPTIDGVSNVVLNYARIIEERYGDALVVTPEVPGADDGSYGFPVLRYPSIDTRKLLGYVTGYPFSPEIAHTVQKDKVELLHLHCPMTSAVLAWQLRESLDLPLVLTWHTKYDIDIANAIHSRILQKEAIAVLINNVRACDEVWTVSRGAGENLRSLGYEGDYIVMENGVDIPRGRADEALVEKVTEGIDLPEDVPVFLFVGRLMWYKGIRIILDALARLASEGAAFRMVFVGGGGDEKEIKAYCSELGLDGRCFFTGPVRDRDALRAWYTRADLFLFPSTFDTNGLVVREAAACGTAAVMIEGSCAAEGITDGRNGFLIKEDPKTMAALLRRLLGEPDLMAKAGENAMNEIYLSWEDAVGRAAERYETVLDRFRSGVYTRRHRPQNEFMRSQGELMQIMGDMRAAGMELFDDFRNAGREFAGDAVQAGKDLVENVKIMRDELRSALREKL